MPKNNGCHDDRRTTMTNTTTDDTTTNGNQHLGCMHRLFNHPIQIPRFITDRRHTPAIDHTTSRSSSSNARPTKHHRRRKSSHAQSASRNGQGLGFLERVSTFTMEYNTVPVETKTQIDEANRSPEDDRYQTTHKRANSQFGRSSSIHHLECNEYVVPDEIETTNDFFEDGRSSVLGQNDVSDDSSENADGLVVEGGYESDPGSSRAHQDESEKQRILQEKINEVKSYTEEDGGGGSRGTSFVEALELFNANREVFLQIIQNPDSVVSENYFRDLRNSSTSFIKRGGSSTDHKTFRNSKSGKKEEEEKKKDGKMVLGDRISMDGVLHRIPYGRTLSLSQNVTRDGAASYAAKKDSSRRFTKSRSLTDSLERYSSLLESAAAVAAKLSGPSGTPSPERSGLSRPPSNRKVKSLSSKSLTRIHSLPECEAYLTDGASPLISRIVSFQQWVSPMHQPHTVEIVSSSSDDDKKKPNLQEASISTVDEEKGEKIESIAGDEKIMTMAEKAENLSRINNTSAEFDYMIGILKKSGFGNGTYNYQFTPDGNHLQLDHSIFEESERTSTHRHITASADDGYDVNLNHLLLFDLINQVLMEMWEGSFAMKPWLKRFGYRRQLRPTFPASQSRVLLDDISGTIGWYLSYESDRTIEYVVSRDVERSDDGWMNVGYEIDDVGVDFVDMILDDLLDDVIVDLLDSTNYAFNFGYGLYY